MSKYNIYKNINPNIFRGYDIRAIYGQDLNEDIKRRYYTYLLEITMDNNQ